MPMYVGLIHYQIRPNLTTFNRFWADFDRFWPLSNAFGQVLIAFDRFWTDFDRFWTEFERIWSAMTTFDRLFSVYDHFWPVIWPNNTYMDISQWILVQSSWFLVLWPSFWSVQPSGTKMVGKRKYSDWSALLEKYQKFLKVDGRSNLPQGVKKTKKF